MTKGKCARCGDHVHFLNVATFEGKEGLVCDFCNDLVKMKLPKGD